MCPGVPQAPCRGYMAGGCVSSLPSPTLLLLLGPLSGPVSVFSSGGGGGQRSCFSPSVGFTGGVPVLCWPLQPCSASWPPLSLPGRVYAELCCLPRNPEALVQGLDFLGSSPPAGIWASPALLSLWGRWRRSSPPGSSSFLGSE